MKGIMDMSIKGRSPAHLDSSERRLQGPTAMDLAGSFRRLALRQELHQVALAFMTRFERADIGRMLRRIRQSRHAADELCGLGVTRIAAADDKLLDPLGINVPRL